MQCIINHRGGGSLTLGKLFRAVNIKEIVGNNSTSNQPIYITGSKVTSTANGYIFVISYGYMAVWKVSSGAVVTTVLKAADGNHCGVYVNTNTKNVYARSTAAYNSGTSTSSSRATIALVTFPYDTATVDALLSGMTFKRYDGALGTSQTRGTASITDPDGTLTQDVTIAAVGDYLDFWLPQGTTMTKVSGTASNAAAIYNITTLRTISAYVHNIIGLTE